MRCAIFGNDDDLRQRLRRIVREHGWYLADMPSVDIAKSHSDVDVVFVLARDGLDEAAIRATRRALPSAIILVLGESSLQAYSTALSAGATGFIQHDLSSRYVAARLTALIRLRKSVAPIHITAGEVKLDLQHRRCSVSGSEIPLSRMEFDLLALLAAGDGRTLPRSELIEELWKSGTQPEDNTLEVHVSRLRRKLRPVSSCRIETVRGIGYRLDASKVRAADLA